MSDFRDWIPLSKPFPINTFLQRLMRKWLWIAKNILHFAGNLDTHIGSRLGFSGALMVGVTSSGNILLQLNKDYALGCKGTVLELPRDRIIYKSVKDNGFWELEESKFLARGLIKVSQKPRARVALLDIGANTGLVTLQAMNLSKTTNEVFLFEPVPRHASAIKQNLMNLSDVHINEFALSDKNGRADIFTQSTNHGNTSLLNSVVPTINMITTQIELVETTQYCKDFLNDFDGYVIKCDTQGMDALILSRFPLHIWKNCESAVIEVWSISEVDKKDVENLLSMCETFDHVSWHPEAGNGRAIKLNEVREFWLSKSGTSRNLFLSNNI